MSVTSESVTRSVELLHALADPTRMAIIELLSRRDHCVCHLVETLELKQSAVSHHVGVLRRSGLISSYPHPGDRRWLYYRLERPALSRLTSDLDALVDEAAYNPVPLPCPIDEIDEARV